MSSRAMRKLHGGDDLVILGVDNDEEVDEVVPSLPNPEKSKKKKKSQQPANPFDLLNDDTEQSTEVREDESPEEKASEEIAENIHQPTNKVRKKKKKKKNKKKDQETEAVNNVEDDIDASIREVNALLGELPTTSVSATAVLSAAEMKALLSIEHKNLNPDNEMKRIFGSQVVQNDMNRGRRGAAGGRGRVHYKSTWLTQPKNTWPHMAKSGLSMRLLETKNSIQYFTFEHSPQYQQTQFQFLDAVESLNPDNIMNVLALSPYHVDSLLQLSEVCKMSEDVAMAKELIERALYAFEMNFHPSFNLTQSTCRLDYRRPENRALFLALFRHIGYVGGRGCYRTALELCKLLLSLDPDEDPLCALLMIDFYAIRNEQYNFLIRLFSEWEYQRNLSQLPNFAFSTALAMFHQRTHDQQDLQPADDMLQRSLMQFPGILMPLLDKCGIVPTPEVSSHAFFSLAKQARQPEALQQLNALYVGRCHASWKEPEVVVWLERNVQHVLSRVDKGDPAVKEYENRQKVRYRGTPRNVYRHILISEIKDATAALPPELAHSPVMSYDPLPPTDSIVSYQRPQRNTVGQNASPLGLFFRSLLPNYNPQEVVDDLPGAVGGGGAPNDLRQGIGALMDAMRDLLNNIQPVAPPVEGQNEQNGEGEDEEPQEWD